ncbi:hypothetical protein [Azospirillum palustre]
MEARRRARRSTAGKAGVRHKSVNELQNLNDIVTAYHGLHHDLLL